jgi:hypothetical protein
MQINESEVRAAVVTALAAVRSGGEVAGIEIASLADELRDIEWFANVSADAGQARVFTTVHHDTDLVYEAPVDAFDVDAATTAVCEDIRAGAEQFDEMFPD